MSELHTHNHRTLCLEAKQTQENKVFGSFSLSFLLLAYLFLSTNLLVQTTNHSEPKEGHAFPNPLRGFVTIAEEDNV